MYAIRSYYGSAVGRRAATLEQERDRLVEEVTSFRALAEQAEELRQLSGLQAPDLGSVRPAEVYRITSYNVCYTKLLRIRRTTPM